ncbi:Npun_F5749 family FMN-dependent PPOX-type flavoprotein [Leptolyngbya sp. FACHB-261]|uniref:Npun_F5749 family FMN-dependent PPOX-type flavoprotein n=1 Tax=Leptolyngbya sp. FACHB-261 TaxID=2692806 RepID=UPI001686CDF2|nr:Npun_F5749 family FMN-dependent PPOX-type flavoprotein [Leptolyngbya sp. FACHB-261]MBD2104732.1 pyridoxamine 5'-phosphate oxidase family protein [Leptolyngbya sp. FACHB-261]
MTLAPWRSILARALHRNRSLPYARYFQLATVSADGRPANRTVVFRDFLEGTNRLKIVTDVRSEKVVQLSLQPWAEACWYFPNTREQFRLQGQLLLIDAKAPEPQQSWRYQAWQVLSEAARAQFSWPTPAQPRQPETLFTSAAPDAVEPLTNFCLLLLEPVSVDHLELRGSPQDRTVYQLCEGDWTVQSLNP